MMKLAILGYGRQSLSAFEYWQHKAESITFCDSRTDIKLPAGAKSQLGKNYLYDLDQFDLIVRGTPTIHPKDILKANPGFPDILSKVTSNTNEFFRICPTKNIIGVTGTKGKGTTSTLIAKMLEATGKRVHLGGNIGTPPLDLLKGTGALHGDAMQGAGEQRTEAYTEYGEGAAEPATQQSAPSSGGVSGSAGQQARTMQSIQPDDWVVLELANFQLIDLKYSPTLAVCLMVEPEHLDWHSDNEEYMQAKQQLFLWQKAEDAAVFYAENKNSRHITSVSAGKKIPYYAAPGAEVIDGYIVIGSNKLVKTADLRLLGKHNWQNICAAVTTVWQLAQDAKAIQSVLENFSGLPYRIEQRGEKRGVKFYNDSFASQPEATIAAIEAIAEDKVLIIGGYERGLSLEKLADTLKKHEKDIEKVILVGTSAARCAEAFEAKGFFNYVNESSRNMSAIVNRALEFAHRGNAVVLSPAFASFDMFDNFEERGNAFNEAVKRL